MNDALTHKALAHPLRHRLISALRGEPATISQLARRLSVLKGNVAYHLGVLTEAGFVRPAEARQVRGGTEQYFALAIDRIDLPGDDLVSTTAMLTASASPFTQDPDSMLQLRHIRLTARHAAELRETLERIVTEAAAVPSRGAVHGVLVGLYRRP